MRIKIQKQQIPWAMAAGRAILGPVLVVGERGGWNGLAMAGLVVTALASDIFDGVLARRWRCDTPAVRLFDSMADTVFYLCVAAALWMGHPQLLRGNAALLGVLLALEAARFAVNFAKFGKPASYHSLLAKTWGPAMASAVVAAFAAPGWHGASASLAAALALGIACDLEGLAMSAILPVWRRDVKTLLVAWRIRQELCGPRLAQRSGSHALAKGSVAAMALLCMLALPALAAEPGQAAYAGGTAGIAEDTPGTLDTTSGTALVFRYKASGGTGEIAIPYATIRTVEVRNDVVRHLGFLPALGAGLVAARQRRYTLSIGYADASGVAQVTILQLAERDQRALQAVLRTRAPKSCMLSEYVKSCPVARPVPAGTAAAPTPATPAAIAVPAAVAPAVATEVSIGKPPAAK